MLHLQKQGKIRSYGISVSDHRPDEANEVICAGRVPLLEISYSLLDPKHSYVAPWEEMPEWEKETDRAIFEAIAAAVQNQQETR